jgi:uncharacterized protein
MANYFLDTSALVKRYVVEPGHQWVRSLYDVRPKHTLIISQITIAECVATLCRKAREQSISVTERDTLIGLFYRHRPKLYSTIQVTNTLCTQAGTLCQTHRLRAYDAIQLASALAYRQQAFSQHISAPIFVSADVQLLSFAAAEGLITENPNTHP